MGVKESKIEWRERYIETVTLRAGDVLPHPNNPKIHPANQLEPLSGLLEEVGKVDSLKAYRSEREGGKLVYWDGHARMGLRPDESWRVDVYNLTDAEVDLLLATFDPIGWQAEQGRAKLEALMSDITTGNAALMSFLSQQAESVGIISAEDNGADTSTQVGALEYRVIIQCESEAQQAELLQRFEDEGLKCQALIS